MEKYSIDDLWIRLLNDESWEVDPMVRGQTVFLMRLAYVGCPLPEM